MIITGSISSLIDIDDVSHVIAKRAFNAEEIQAFKYNNAFKAFFI